MSEKKNEREQDNHKESSKKKDFWDKIQAIGLGSIFIALVGILFTIKSSNQQESSRDYQMATQLFSSREESEMKFRGDMFDKLLTKFYLQEDVSGKINALQLFQDNFHDIFNGSAFFEVIKEQIDKECDSSKRIDMLNKLIGIAKKNTRQQLEMIKSGATDAFEESFQLPEGENFCKQVIIKKDENENAHFIKICIEAVEKDRMSVDVKMKVGDHEAEADADGDTIRFSLSYFDLPFTNNTLLDDGHRITIVLKDISCPDNEHKDNCTVTLKLVEFPASYVISGYRPQIKGVDKILKSGLRETHRH